MNYWRYAQSMLRRLPTRSVLIILGPTQQHRLAFPLALRLVDLTQYLEMPVGRRKVAADWATCGCQAGPTHFVLIHTLPSESRTSEVFPPPISGTKAKLTLYQFSPPIRSGSRSRIRRTGRRAVLGISDPLRLFNSIPSSPKHHSNAERELRDASNLDQFRGYRKPQSSQSELGAVLASVLGEAAELCLQWDFG